MPLLDSPILGALAVCVAGAVLAVRGWRGGQVPDATGWVRVPGTVVAWEGRGEVLYPVVEYPLPDGAPHRARMPTTVDTGIYRTGVPVTVLVDPADPRRAQLPGSATHAALFRALFLLLGCLALVAGAIALGVLLVLRG